MGLQRARNAPVQQREPGIILVLIKNDQDPFEGCPILRTGEHGNQERERDCAHVPEAEFACIEQASLEPHLPRSRPDLPLARSSYAERDVTPDISPTAHQWRPGFDRSIDQSSSESTSRHVAMNSMPLLSTSVSSRTWGGSDAQSSAESSTRVLSAWRCAIRLSSSTHSSANINKRSSSMSTYR